MIALALISVLLILLGLLTLFTGILFGWRIFRRRKHQEVETYEEEEDISIDFIDISDCVYRHDHDPGRIQYLPVGRDHRPHRSQDQQQLLERSNKWN